MSKNDIPVSPRQMLYLALTMFGPLLLTVALVSIAPVKAGQSGGSKGVAFAIVGTILFGLLAILVCAIRRRAVTITPESLIVRHSVYTLVVNRSEVNKVQIRQIASLDQLGLSTRKNGIAAFGYFSGWFWGLNGDLTFCAMSQWPVQLITFEGSIKCKHLALSAAPELARDIETWINT